MQLTHQRAKLVQASSLRVPYQIFCGFIDLIVETRVNPGATFSHIQAPQSKAYRYDGSRIFEHVAAERCSHPRVRSFQSELPIMKEDFDFDLFRDFLTAAEVACEY